MSDLQIRKAERKKAKLRLGICGASGSGKTRSALEIAAGMGGKIGMIDTEAGRGELYADAVSKYDTELKLEYDIIRLEAPYSTERYIECMKKFERAGYDILIIDSLSHAWSGDGGVLSVVDAAGGQFQNGWKVGTKKQNTLIDAIISSPMHVICCMRTKTDYVMEQNEKGKMAPRKIGLAPVQRDQMEYEFTVFMAMNQDHIAHVSKDNTEMFDQQYITPSPEMGVKLMEWLERGVSGEDYFRKNELPNIVHDILDSYDLLKLREVYSSAHHEWASRYPKAFEEIALAKDKRKAQLENPADDFDLPATQSGNADKTLGVAL